MEEPHPLQQLIGAAAQARATEEAQAAVEADRAFRLDMMANAYDKGGAYNNIIMTAGYAGSFAIWAFTRDLMPGTAHAWVALLLTISLATYIGFEVLSMVLRSIQILALAGHVRNQGSPQAYADAVKAFEDSAKRKLVWIGPVWVLSLAVAVTSVALAAGICLWHFGVRTFGVILFGTS